MLFYGETNTGKVRPNNEDAFKLQAYDNNVKFLVIADGMGGHNKGEFASEAAIREIFSYMENIIKDTTPSNNIDFFSMHLKKAIEKANTFIFNYAATRAEYFDMGTTVVAGLIEKDNLIVCNVGDSRLYLFRDGVLNQITEDNTYIQELLKSGAITKEEARHHENRNMILRAVGTEQDINIDLYNVQLKSSDRLISCTDGLTDMLECADIVSVLNEEEDAALCVKKLIEKANAAGGIDNITVVIYDYID